MKTKLIVVLLTAFLTTAWLQPASADVDTSRIYAGGGLGFNDLDGASDSATGWQILGGYDLGIRLGEFDTAVEIGFMSSGDFDFSIPGFGVVASESAEGLWATWVPSIVVKDKISALGRIGLDFGDDDGLMLGIGGQYDISPAFFMRVEYVIRDDIDSFQFNLLYQFK